MTDSATAAPPKRPGRPRGAGRPAGASGVTRDTLLETALDLLATTPPSALTGALVARAADVDPSLITYYFGNRAGLLVAAAEKLTSGYTVRVRTAVANAPDDAAGRLRARIAALIDMEARYPFFYRLLVEEIMPNDSAAAQAMLTGLTTRATDAYAAIVADGAAQGQMRDVDGKFLWSAVIGMAAFYQSTRNFFALIEGGLREEADMREAYIDFVTRLVMNGVLLPGVEA